MADFYYEEHGRNNDIVSVVLSGKLDSLQCDYLFKCIQGQIEDGYKKLILDCSQLEQISSVGLAMLVRVNSRMLKHGGDVKLAGVHGLVASTIKIVQLDKMLQMYSSVDEAITAHGG